MTKNGSDLYVIGAGFAGQNIAREIRAKRGIFGEVVAFLDDDSQKIGRTDRRHSRYSVRSRTWRSLLRMNPADEAVIAIPSASREYLRELYDILKKAGFEKIRILPGISQITRRRAPTSFRPATSIPQDLLGRTPVAIGLKESLKYLRGKRVLVTGAGGSIGGELARQLLSGGAQRLYLVRSRRKLDLSDR